MPNDLIIKKKPQMGVKFVQNEKYFAKSGDFSQIFVVPLPCH